MTTQHVAILAQIRPHRWLPPAISLPLLRRHFEAGASALAASMRAQLPDQQFSVQRDLAYSAARGRDTRFDLVRPQQADPSPVVVWVHGGGWFCGSKENVLPYLELLATQGFAGVALNYPRAPEHPHPEAPRAVMHALRHLTINASEYGIDPQRIILAGDSAGAQVAASVALACIEPSYAGAIGCPPATAPGALRGAALFCGAYDPESFLGLGGLATAAMASSMWALAADRDWVGSGTAQLMTIKDHLTSDFPRTFLRAGNADPFTATNTAPLAESLLRLGVDVDFRVVGEPDDPAGHEYQFGLGGSWANETVVELVEFLEQVCA